MQLRCEHVNKDVRKEAGQALVAMLELVSGGACSNLEVQTWKFKPANHFMGLNVVMGAGGRASR